MAIRTDDLPCRVPTSLSTDVFARSLWWLAGGAQLRVSAGRESNAAHEGAFVTTPEKVRTLEQVRDVLSGLLALTLPSRQDDVLRYRWIEAALVDLRYRQLARVDKGQVLNYLQRLTGYSRAQVTRLVARWIDGQPLTKQHARPEHAFARRYQSADVALLAEIDGLLGPLSGAATRCVLRRQRDRFGDMRLASLASISVSQLYHLRQSAEYQALVLPGIDLVPPRQTTVGLRRTLPAANGPGFLVVDSVSSNADTQRWQVCVMDLFTQWRVLLSEPAPPGAAADWPLLLRALCRQLPFGPRAFMAAAGGPASCHQVAANFEQARIDVAARADDDDFRLDPWSRFVNLHRPCAFAHDRPESGGQEMSTPLDRLLGLPDVEGCLRPGVSSALLRSQGRLDDDLQAAAAARRFQALADDSAADVAGGE